MGRQRGAGRIGALAAAIALAAILPSCGSEPTLTASELVQRVNAEGVAMRLGRELPTGGEAEQLYAVRLPPLPGQPEPPPGSEAEAGASGSLYVFGDSGAASDQLDACRKATGLYCYRASNIVVVLDEESAPLEARRLAVAMRRLAD